MSARPETLWRRLFAPERVEVPWAEYKAFVPCVRVIPIGLDDTRVAAVDAGHADVLAKCYASLAEVARNVNPTGIPIPIKQLLLQLPAILSGAASVIEIRHGMTVVKRVPVNRHVRRICQAIRSVYNAQLLLFEDYLTESFDRPGEFDAIDADLVSFVKLLEESEKARCISKLVQDLASGQLGVVIFTRNVLVCRALNSLLQDKGLRSASLYADSPTDARDAVRAFARKQLDVLVLTRQLFGRGFDLPTASAAIFYSAKNDCRVMWQEILRIRGTVSNIKNAYVLFFSWTSESRKMQRFLRGVQLSGGRFDGSGYRWAYNDTLEFEDVPEFDEGADSDMGGRANGSNEHHAGLETEESYDAIDEHSACSAFVSRLKAIQKDETSDEGMLREVSVSARKARMFDFWDEELIVTLCCQVASTLVEGGRVAPFAKARRRLIKVFHPDLHQNCSEREMRLWNALTAAVAA